MGPDTFLSVLQSSHSVDGDDGDDGRCTCGRRVPMRSGFCMCGKLIASAWSCTCRAPRIYHPPAPACSFCTSPPTGRAPTAEELAANMARVRAYKALRQAPPLPLMEAASDPQLLAAALEVLGGTVSRVKMAPYDKGAEDVPQDGHVCDTGSGRGTGRDAAAATRDDYGRWVQALGRAEGQDNQPVQTLGRAGV